VLKLKDFGFGVVFLLSWLVFYPISWFFIGKDFLGDQFSFIAVMLLLIFLMLVYMAYVKVFMFRGVFWGRALLLIGLLSFALLFVWNIASDDLYTYIYRGRVQALYNANPYLTSYSNYPQDAFYDELENIWVSKTSLYGPVFSFISFGIATVAGDSLLFSVLLYKILFAFLFTFSSYVVYKTTKSKKALILFGLNPVLIFEFLLNSHMSIIMIFFLLFSLYFIVRGRGVGDYLLGLVLFELSVLTKPTVAIFTPFIGIYILKKLVGYRAKLLFIIVGLVVSLMILILAYVPYWEGLRTFSYLSEVYRHVTPRPSPLMYVLSVSFSRGLFWVIYLYLLLRFAIFARKFTSILLLKLLIAVYFAALLMYFTVLMPWYLTPLLALLCVVVGLLRRGVMWIYLVSFLELLLYTFTK